MLFQEPISPLEESGACAEPANAAEIGACIGAAKGALSDNTERAVRADLAIYAAWCRERGVVALPAEAETLAAFVDAMAASRAPATVRRYVFSIAFAHRATRPGRDA